MKCLFFFLSGALFALLSWPAASLVDFKTWDFDLFGSKGKDLFGLKNILGDKNATTEGGEKEKGSLFGLSKVFDGFKFDFPSLKEKEKEKKKEQGCFEGDASTLPVFEANPPDGEWCLPTGETSTILEEYRTFKANNPGLHAILEAGSGLFLNVDADMSSCTGDEFADVVQWASNGASSIEIDARGYTFDNLVRVSDETNPGDPSLEISGNAATDEADNTVTLDGDILFPCLQNTASTVVKDPSPNVLTGFNQLVSARFLLAIFKDDLEAIHGFNSLTELGGVSVNNNPNLVEISGFGSFNPTNQFRQANSVQIFANADGASLAVAPNLDAAASAWATANPESCYRAGADASQVCP
uniref:Uncharacterized protein n=1 Tax=Chromera velia CCMP2878 TaxID=1169474 RepID=A0A0G4HBA8_9ALVE|eukprot:Cvel_931.t1-p1 / transcript=Cvel_931.t1 / gene=Cvel_931 / organism=Chromera_velia_CCMP2878 / gene_product=hypothetical protein / transcript_product=hypothetical protein / location=Cvel_scaffold29:136070-137134(+) / protein_length=355 / sequence_SO=supercontig / SO=protein_coding / is_pseudo=false